MDGGKDLSGDKLKGGAKLEDKNAAVLSPAEGDDEGLLHPLDILPGEIWLEVLKWLGNPRDLLHVIDTHPVFEEQLESGKGDMPGAGRGVCQLVEVLPLVLKWLRKADILSLRQVCKRVCLTVDKVVEENPRINPYEHFGLFPWLTPPLSLDSYERMTYENRRIKLPSGICPFVILNSIAKFTEVARQLEMEKQKGKQAGRRLKIVGGKVRMKIYLVADELATENGLQAWIRARFAPMIIISKERLSNLLITLSGFVQFVDYTLVDPLANSHDVYTLLRDTIQAMTNLRRVELASIFFRAPSLNRDEYLQQMNFIADHRLPSRPTLESIRMEFDFPGIIMQELADKYGNHLKELSLVLVNCREFRTVGDDDEGRQQFSAMQQLNLIFPRYVGNSFPLVDAPNLRRLGFNRLGDGHNIPAEALGLLLFLNRYPLLLELQLSPLAIDYGNVNLNVPAAAYEMIREQRLDLQTLRHLTLEIPGNMIFPFQLHFFSQVCPNLESITVNDYGSGWTHDFDLELLRGSRMENSRIWHESPSLQMVKRVPHPVTNDRQAYVCFRPAILNN